MITKNSFLRTPRCRIPLTVRFQKPKPIGPPRLPKKTEIAGFRQPSCSNPTGPEYEDEFITEYGWIDEGGGYRVYNGKETIDWIKELLEVTQEEYPNSVLLIS